MTRTIEIGSEEPGAPLASVENIGETGYSHVISLPILLGIFGALIALTGTTVAVTQFDLGPTWNLVVAMIVATVKASLVAAFFMHLLWDKRFNLLLLLSAVLFLVLFLGISVNDRSEYQNSIDAFNQAKDSAIAK